jgi:methionyl-tRNA formyltransferase
LRVVYAGAGLIAVRILSALVQSSHQVVALLQDGRKCKGWRRTIDPLLGRTMGSAVDPVGLAASEGIPIVWLENLSEEELAPIRALEPDLLLVGGFGIIFPGTVLSLPKIGAVNAHWSLLPHHRGPHPATAAILAGDKTTGVTFHVMTERIDAGDILAQEAFPITPRDTASNICRKAAFQAGKMVVPLMNRIEKEGLVGTPQDVSQGTYDRRLKHAQLRISWSWTASELDRKVRAGISLVPWFEYQGRKVFLRRVNIVENPKSAPPGTVIDTHPLTVAMSQGAIRISVAFRRQPILLPWPMLWQTPKVGEKLD